MSKRSKYKKNTKPKNVARPAMTRLVESCLQEEFSEIEKFATCNANPAEKIFYKQSLEYSSFPKVEKKIPKMVSLLNKYLELIDSKTLENQEKIKEILNKMMRHSVTLDVFYFGFSKYLNRVDNESLINGEEKTFLFEKLLDSILEMAEFCSERDLAAAIGYFMDILSLDSRNKEEKDYESISYYSIKKNMLDICKENLLKNVYFTPYMLYEIAIREEDPSKKKKYFDYCLSAISEIKSGIDKNINAYVKNVNNSYLLHIKLNIFFELIKNYYEHDPLEQFHYYLKNIRDLMVDLQGVNILDISFNLYCNNHDNIISEIEKNIIDFDFHNLSDLDKLDPDLLLKKYMVLNTYAFILRSILEQCQYFESLSNQLTLEHVDFSEPQSPGAPDNLLSAVRRILAKVDKICETNILQMKEISEKIKNIRSKVGLLNEKIGPFINIISQPYYAAMKQFIINTVPENFANELISTFNTEDNKISFSLKSCRELHKILKKYGNFISYKEGILTLDLDNPDLNINLLKDISLQIYRIKKWMSVLQSQRQLEILNSVKNLERPQITITLSEPKKNPASELEAVSALVLDEETKNDVPPKQRIKRNQSIRTRFQQKKTKESEQKEIMPETSSKHTKLLQEAIKILEPENKDIPDELIESKKYTINFVLNSNTRKKILIAVGKELTDQNGNIISEESQRKINNVAENPLFISKFGQDGIKPFYDFCLKVRYANGKSYRAKPVRVISVSGKNKSGEDACLYVYDKVFEKNKTKRRRLQ